MLTLRRYWTAFVGALRLTLRGEKAPPPTPVHPVVGWGRRSVDLVAAARKAADAAGLNEAARKALKIRVDGRAVSVETLLAAVQFHAAQEYPNLLRNGVSQRALNAVYATNINDHYSILKLIETPDLSAPALRAALQALADHLEHPPSA